MNEVTMWIRTNGLWALLWGLGGVVVVGLLLAAVSTVWTIVVERAWVQDFCLASACIEYTATFFSGSIQIVAFFSKLAVWIATVGGIVVALLNYINSTSATAFGNHVSHSKIFYDYLSAEIVKRERIRPVNVDIYRMYALAFNSSRLGVMRVSDEYRACIEEISDVISASNTRMSAGSIQGFQFKDHQHRLIAALRKVGVSLTTQPRVDFFEVEEEVFGLLDAINHVFCAEFPIDRLPKREYR